MSEKYKNNTFTKEQINKSEYFVEKKDGISVNKIFFPNEMQVGLQDSNFNSDLTVTGMIKGTIQKLADGLTDYLQAGSGITITNNSDGSITIGSSGGGGGVTLENGSNDRVVTANGTSALNGEANLTFDGSTLVCNGNAKFSEYIYHEGDDDTFIRFEQNSLMLEAGGRKFVEMINDPSSGYAGITFMSGGAPTSFNESQSSDVNFYVSGSVESRGTATRATSVFGGDTVVSGSLWQLSKPGFAICDKHFYSAFTNPTSNRDYHLKWHDGVASNDNPETAANNHFWKYFPYGGEILSVFATGGDASNSSTSNPFTENLIFAVYEWTNAFAQSTTNADSTPAPLGHMTASVGNLFVDNNGAGSYLHRSVYDFTNSEVTGSMIIPRNQRVCFAVKSNAGSTGFERTTINVVYKLGLK